MKPKIRTVLSTIGVVGLAAMILIFAVIKSSDYVPEIKPATTQQQLKTKLAADSKLLKPSPSTTPAPLATPNPKVAAPPAPAPAPPPAPQPQPAPVATKEPPLPNSGPGTLFVIFLGISLVAYLACQPVLSRRTIVFYK